MSDEKSDAISVNINAEHTDRSVADIIRALLHAPAKEAGSLIADGIGIFGDKIRLKRMNNLQLGFEKVGSNLKELGVEMKDITPPNEEEAYLMLEGLSLAGDEGVRDIWAGLFASALDPNTKLSVDRSFISVLQSLSPIDAKVIDLLAFIIKTDQKLLLDAGRATFKNRFEPTKEELIKSAEVNSINADRRDRAVSAILEKQSSYGLKEIGDPNWSLNLMRLGIIERTQPQQRPSGLGQIARMRDRDEGLGRLVEHLDQANVYQKYIEERNAVPPKAFFNGNSRNGALEQEVVLSAYGKRLAEACGLI